MSLVVLLLATGWLLASTQATATSEVVQLAPLSITEETVPEGSLKLVDLAEALGHTAAHIKRFQIIAGKMF